MNTKVSVLVNVTAAMDTQSTAVRFALGAVWSEYTGDITAGP